MNRVEVSFAGIDELPWAEKLVSWMEGALDAMDKADWDVSVLLCDDATIQDLNGRYRQKDEATDVLSFESGDSYEDGEFGLRFNAGDIVVSLNTLSENASYFSVDQDEELKRLVLHGLLHLSGMDHENNESDQPMLMHQEALLKILPKERILP